jgi:hypothetical protein
MNERRRDARAGRPGGARTSSSSLDSSVSASASSSSHVGGVSRAIDGGDVAIATATRVGTTRVVRDRSLATRLDSSKKQNVSDRSAARQPRAAATRGSDAGNGYPRARLERVLAATDDATARATVRRRGRRARARDAFV